MPEFEAILAAVRQDWHLIVPLGVVGVLSWSVWLYRKLASMRYRPVLNDHRTTTSVIVPSFHEDPDVLGRCLDGRPRSGRPKSSWCSTSMTRRLSDVSLRVTSRHCT